MATLHEVEPIASEPTVYFEGCLMKPDEAKRVFQMIANKFPEVKLVLHDDGCEETTVDGEVWVTFEVPREGIYMPDFFKELARASQPPEACK